MRFALGLLNMKESISIIGVRISLSVVYLPLALVGFAGLLAGADQLRTNRLSAMTFAGLLALVMVGVPAFVHDIGFVIFALPLAMWGLLIHLRGPRGRVFWIETVTGLAWAAALTWVVFAPLPRALDGGLGQGLVWTAILLGGAMVVVFSRSVVWAAPALVAVMVLLVPHVVPRPTVDRFEAARVASLAEQLRFLDDYARHSRNQLRIWNSAQPDRVREAGTQVAEEFAGAMAHLRDYTRTPPDGEGAGIFGRGYLNLDPPTVLAAYQFNDNVSAIHLISPFGRAGAVAFLALLWVIAALQTPPARTEGAPWSRVAGSLALWTVTFTATYMVLANLQFAPFTGKNVYFLAATSTGDLMEGAILIAIAATTLGRRNV